MLITIKSSVAIQMNGKPCAILFDFQVWCYIFCFVNKYFPLIPQMKGHFPGRLIVLIGWNVGALVAVHVRAHTVVMLTVKMLGHW